ncbi:hypothetical protein [Aeromonas sp. Y318-3]|uniref:hypothetical protein n=1 Tax=Aeromonas sp. Y318-3 TaxID=2990509 RepID=UPI0022E94091|nr:hypothetical protein [Aeromonas sp. Y318-3]
MIIVEDSFDLKNEGRAGGNRRRYIIHAVKAMFQSPVTQEALKLGEAYGYFGHTIREMTGKMRPREMEVVTIDGKPVQIQVVPSNRTLAVDVDENGIVNHKQEILDTPPGRIVQAMWNDKVGGWSWATSGSNDPAFGARPRSFFGFDYVKQPNFVPLDRQQAMMESATGERVIELLVSSGVSNGDAVPLFEGWAGLSESYAATRDVDMDIMMMEGLLIEERNRSLVLSRDLDLAKQEREDLGKRREQALMEALDTAPMVFTKDQREAFLRLSTPEDAKVVKMMLESLANMDVESLPIRHRAAPVEITPTPTKGERSGIPLGAVIFQKQLPTWPK